MRVRKSFARTVGWLVGGEKLGVETWIKNAQKKRNDEMKRKNAFWYG